MSINSNQANQSISMPLQSKYDHAQKDGDKAEEKKEKKEKKAKKSKDGKKSKKKKD